MIIKIYRGYSNENQTIGNCIIEDYMGCVLFSSVSLERGWDNNKRNVSCIPLGTYKVVLEYSNKFKKELWEIKGVENRSECKFHSANYWYQLNGCISLGSILMDIDKDGYRDVTSSRRTMNDFHKVLRGEKEIYLTIK